MTTLQSFQAEIEGIRTRELAKTRIQSQPDVIKRTHVDHKPAPKVRKRAVGDTGPSSPVTPKFADESVQDISDLEHSFLVRHTFSHRVFDVPTYGKSYRALYYLPLKEILKRET
jgi:hypothetical protein